MIKVTRDETESYTTMNGKKYICIEDAIKEAEDQDFEAVDLEVYYKGSKVRSEHVERNSYSGDLEYTRYYIAGCFLKSEDTGVCLENLDDSCIEDLEVLEYDADSEEEALDLLNSVKEQTDKDYDAFAIAAYKQTLKECGEDASNKIFFLP